MGVLSGCGRASLCALLTYRILVKLILFVLSDISRDSIQALLKLGLALLSRVNLRSACC